VPSGELIAKVPYIYFKELSTYESKDARKL
jgi:hypothetical protein